MSEMRWVRRAALLTTLFTCACHSVFGLDEFSEADSDGTLDAGTASDEVMSEGTATEDAELTDAEPTDVEPTDVEPTDPDVSESDEFEGTDAGAVEAPLDASADAASPVDAAAEQDASVEVLDAGPSQCDLGCPDDAPVCSDGLCVQCNNDEVSCVEGAPARCSDHQWSVDEPCVGSVCQDGACVVPSCDGLPTNCGVSLTDDCCRSLPVEGGEFHRNAAPAHPAVVSSFLLDKYEVTVGRFRQFLAALSRWSPEPGVGAYPRVPGSGWQSGWPLPDPATIAGALDCYEDEATWTDEPGDNENRPINCITWYEAFAFCAWDGGYLPTESQWDYASLGGSQHRYYPWSEPPISSVFGGSYSNYYCEEFTPRCFDTVGARPSGDGRFGQSDLGGNTREWVQDDYVESYLECPSGVNCLTRDASATSKIVRGGSVGSGGSSGVVNTLSVDDVPPLTRYPIDGFRCARPTLEEIASPSASPDAGVVTECEPGERDCDGASPAVCDESGRWVTLGACEISCHAGVCTECRASERGCDGNVQLDCGDDGFWVPGAPCGEDTPVCDAGLCVDICAARNDCGPEGTDNCCQTLTVPGGTSNRNNDASYASTLSAFELERFEVTVGRFREFVEAYPSSRPASGQGAHPNIPGSGWDAAWDGELPETQQALVDAITSNRTGTCTLPTVVTYTAEPSANEARAMNCVTWYEAFAFCTWAGGRLPTLAEHSFAAVGGDEQRVYPWSGADFDSAVIDIDHATYDGNECPENVIDNSTCVTRVGSKVLGNGRWGHADLVGNVAEFVLDALGDLPTPCVDCANIEWTQSRMMLGGAYDGLAGADLADDPYMTNLSRNKYAGIRCVMP